MKLFFALAIAASFTVGIFGGLLLGGTAVRTPARLAMVEEPVDQEPLEPMRCATPVEARPAAAEPPARMDLPAAREEGPTISVLSSASPADDSALGAEDDTVSSRLPLESDQNAMRAWLPFRWFVNRHRIDTRSLPDETLTALFDRFAKLEQQRTEEIVRIARPHLPGEPEREQPANDADATLVDAAEARYAVLEEGLAIEFRDRR